MLMRWLLEAPKNGGWLPGEPTLWLEGLNFQSHTLTSGEGEGLEGGSTANGQC